MKETTSLRQFVAFALGEDVYALDIECVACVVAAGATTRVPLADPFLDGLANVRGALMPVIDGVRWASGSPRTQGAAGKIVVLRRRGQGVGFAVDRMLGVAEAQERDIALLSSGEAELYEGLFMKDETAIRIFRADALFDAIRSRKATGHGSASAATGLRSLRREEKDEEAPKARRLLRFETNGELYGLDMACVRDILPMPERIVRVHGLPPYALGTGVYRNGTAMPIVHFGTLMRRGTGTTPRRVVCAEISTTRGREIVGLAVDWVHDLQSPRQEDAARFAPALEPYSEMIRGVAYAKDGAPMFVLDEERLLSEGGALGRLLPSRSQRREAAPGADAPEPEQTQVEEAGRLYVFFQAGGQEYGMPAGDVKEVRRLTRLTSVPHAPERIAGVANVRGRILTVVGAQAALELGGEKERTTHLIVMEKAGAELGIAVPKVTRVVRIPPEGTRQGMYHCSRDRKLVPLIAPSAFR